MFLTIRLVKEPILVTLFEYFFSVNVFSYEGVPGLNMIGPLLESLIIKLKFYTFLNYGLGINLAQVSCVESHRFLCCFFIFLPLFYFLECKFLFRLGEFTTLCKFVDEVLETTSLYTIYIYFVFFLYWLFLFFWRRLLYLFNPLEGF